MYQNDYNRPNDAWERPVESTARPVEDGFAPPPQKKKSGAGRVVALSLCCALVGGMVGGGGTYLAVQGLPQSTQILEGTRPSAVVNVAQVDNKTPLEADQIYATYVGSTVGITTQITTNYFGQQVSNAASGSGFIITQDGYIVTNYHVIEDATTIQVTLVDGTSYDATLVGTEAENDIAVLKVDATGLKPVVVGNSDDVLVGEPVFAIGNPLGELTFTLTQGIVSAKDRMITLSSGEVVNMLQTDTAINSGNSGGPLFDQYGQVIGITTAKSSGSGSSATVEGLGFAIPTNDIVDMVSDIIENGYVTGKAYLGITVSTIPEADAKQYGISQGALVQSVDSASCAAAAGIQVGDIIVALNDDVVVSHAELIALKGDYQAGDTVTFTVDRKGQLLDLTLTFDEDTPERRAAQAEAQQQEQVEPQQPSHDDNEEYFFPFGNLFPWRY